jgi:hypothetical protein
LILTNVFDFGIALAQDGDAFSGWRAMVSALALFVLYLF